MKNILFSLAAAAVLLSACGKKEQPAAGTETAAATQAAPAGKTAPAPAEYVKDKDTYFKLPGATGGEIDLASYSGQPVMVMFFTETCPYCRKAGPFIQKVYSAYGPKGLNVIGICVQNSAQAALNFAGDLGITFPLAYNGGEVSRQYQTRGVPYIYMLDRNHKIYNVWEGYDPQYDQDITNTVKKVLASK